ncbi:MULTISPECIES: hypothetical protein [Bacillus]|jgi:hypothetical protein|uniref:Lipoprotein n=4 Tax=Bacillus cereus group TaxID=86661 RepID=A0A0A0WRT4_BACMY|nr:MULTISPECIES: hypothetical protein [Bacillus]KXY45405.1 hypothetical protein AT257_12145 [Bacillus cereus]ABY42880.1 conserved hypothetical protein [Bacillus mycoides KBAB4]AIW85870.1 hypothetical protein bwei_3251 [Bacillus mycoides]ETT78040.1 hypothetical protein C174_12627 [Bacillus mycoides FSL H7-687]KMQ13606.1 hypothetical protein TU70_23640 [Bacillus mycoides]
MEFSKVELHKMICRKSIKVIVIISCMMISGCSNRFVEDGNRKHVFVKASKVLVEVVYKIYKR